MKDIINRIESKIKDCEPNAENQFLDALQKFRSLGYEPIFAVIPPNTIIPEGTSTFFGINIIHRTIYTPDGELIPILFGVE